MSRSRTVGLLLGVAGAAFAGSPMAAMAHCQLQEIAAFPVTMQGNRPMIPVSIAGHDMQMLLDTGAGTSYFWGSAARELNFKTEPMRQDFTVQGAGGEDTIVGTVAVKDFKLIGKTIPKLTLYEAARWSMPKSDAGVLGMDFLHDYDLDIDLRSREVHLYLPIDCKGDQVVYWAKAYGMTKLIRGNSDAHRLEAQVSLDGHDTLAIFDTGADKTVVSTRAARDEGIGPGAPTASFHTLVIGQETIRNPELEITNLFSDGVEMHMGAIVGHYVNVTAPDLVIGADFFLAHRVYIASSQGVVYFVYQGGPIFQAPAKGSNPP